METFNCVCKDKIGINHQYFLIAYEYAANCISLIVCRKSRPMLINAQSRIFDMHAHGNMLRG